MPTKKYKPTGNSRRHLALVDYRSVHSGKPYKKLVRGFAENSGRNNQGKITVRHRGAGNKRRLRTVDLLLDKFDIPAKIERIEYDPFRTGFIGLAVYADGDRRYVPLTEGVSVGQKIISSKNKIDLVPGNRMPLKHIPSGMIVSFIELTPGKGAQVARGAGNAASIVAKEGQIVNVKLPSGEVRIFDKEAAATIGQVSNLDHSNIRRGKAGRKRWLRRRPTVKGKSMNPVDHPHGGGEGHSPIGLKHPKTPWGKPAMGYRTRKKGKKSDRLVVRARKGRLTKRS